jgi:hypothetical protein
MTDLTTEARRIDKKEAEKLFNRMLERNDFKYTNGDDELRNILFLHLSGIRKTDVYINEQNNEKYLMDVNIGLKLYELLNVDESGLRTFSDDSFWSYLSLIVLPDLVFMRWGGNPDRFWKPGKRIWLKTVWWYVHLSWQSTEEKTRKIIESKFRSTDTIVSLVERSGDHGYRTELYRKIMAVSAKKMLTQEQFRALMVLNTARLAVVEPELMDGGIDAYVEEIVEIIRKK